MTFHPIRGSPVSRSAVEASIPVAPEHNLRPYRVAASWFAGHPLVTSCTTLMFLTSLPGTVLPCLCLCHRHHKSDYWPYSLHDNSGAVPCNHSRNQDDE